MRKATVGVLLAACVVLQGSASRLLGVRGVIPDLFLILTLVVGLAYGPGEGAGFGLGVGMLQDFVYSPSLGVSAFVKMCTGFVAGVAGRRLFRENILVLVVTVFAGTLASGILFCVLARMLGSARELSPSLRFVVLPAALYNSVLAPVVYWALRRLESALTARSRAGRRVEKE